jgi:hypothetical protein
LFGVIPYENIIDVDDKDDEFLSKPHLYTLPFERRSALFKSFTATVKTIGALIGAGATWTTTNA